MSKILIIGNVIKDIYLQMDERSERFERDEAGVSWMNLGFDGSSHRFFHRSSIFGGAAVSLEVLHNLDIEAEIMGAPKAEGLNSIFEQVKAREYRYILTRGDEVCYFVESARPMTKWVDPVEEPNWILVDRSTVANDKLVNRLSEYLSEHKKVRLAVHANKDGTRAAMRLVQMADILFTEDWFKGKIDDQLVCHLGANDITMGNSREEWNLGRVDLATHLTVFSTMAATVLGVMANGGVARDAVLYAKINAEESTLDRTLSLKNLKQRAKEELANRF